MYGKKTLTLAAAAVAAGVKTLTQAQAEVGLPALLAAGPTRYYRQRGHRGVGTKANQRAALKARRRKGARRA